MWYLQLDTLGIMLGFSVLYVLVSTWLIRKYHRSLGPVLVLFDLLLIAYVSEKLALFYGLYTLTSFGLICLLQRAKGHRRLLLAFFCILDLLPFFYVRGAELVPSLPLWVTLIGFSYNMLKAMDGLFYAYEGRGKVRLLPYASFLLFFPVLTGGPILRYGDYEASYDSPQLPDRYGVKGCCKRVIRGLFKKLVLVTWLHKGVNVLQLHGSHFYLSIAMVFCCYALLYLDLSAYSDLAIGLGTFLGVSVPENFDRPWRAASFTEFWHRWHITLVDWIREHVFFAFRDKEPGKVLSALLGLCTMLLLALWQSFRLRILLCGVYLGLLLALETLLGQTEVDRARTNKGVLALRCLLVVFLFGIGAMCTILSGTEISAVLGGFLKL
jgi:alginate O-acetyltransferase complex protein AlgI